MNLLKSCANCNWFLNDGYAQWCPTCINYSTWELDTTYEVKGAKVIVDEPNKMLKAAADLEYNTQKQSEAYGPIPRPPFNTLDVKLTDKQIEQVKGIVTGQKFDKDKLDWTLLPWKEVEQVLQILEFGAKKYSRDNWKHIEPARYEKAAMRHLISYVTGELNDPETGKSHLAHLVCNALFLMWNDNNQEPLH